MADFRWFKVDTAAIMFSSLSDKKWGRTFRFSAYFREDTDVTALKKAEEEEISPVGKNVLSQITDYNKIYLQIQFHLL